MRKLRLRIPETSLRSELISNNWVQTHVSDSKAHACSSCNRRLLGIFLSHRFLFVLGSLSSARVSAIEWLGVRLWSFLGSWCLSLTAFLKGLYKCPLLLSSVFSRGGFVLDLTTESKVWSAYCCQLPSLGRHDIPVSGGWCAAAPATRGLLATSLTSCSALAASFPSHSWRPGTLSCGLHHGIHQPLSWGALVTSGLELAPEIV